MSSGNASPARTETSLGLTRTPSLHSARNRKRFLDFARNDKNGDVTSRCEVKRAASGAVARMTSLFRFGILALIWFVTSTHTLAEPKPARPEHTNRLAQEKSPYLLQHSHNPVDWYPWGEEAFAKARRENKPIFLSVGYSTCHWCHVMAHESFESEQVAATMNREFVNIKVDREERPDVDRVYMTFVQATTGGGGWPMNVWLTPDLKPFLGGTYFPPEDRYGQPAFQKVLERIAIAWKQDHDRLVEQGSKIVEALRASQSTGTGEAELDGSILDAAYQQLDRSFDPKEGGFGSAPKFPRPVTLNFLMRLYARKVGHASGLQIGRA